MTEPSTVRDAFATGLRPRWRETFVAFRSPNYRLWFLGQLVSLLGTWMQITAQSFLIFELTHSAIVLGYVGFASGLPSWLLMLYGGVVADRLQRRTLLIITQSSMMVLAFVLAAITFTHLVQPWHILGLAFLLGVANAFDAPARLAFVPELVPREHLTNAIAMNATMFNLAAASGPACAGLTYALLGPGWCFVINALSFIAVVVALSLMKLHPQPRRNTEGSTFQKLSEGLRYVAHERVVLTLMLLVASTSLFAISFSTLVPAWTVNILHGDATVNGLLFSARGIGSVIGALYIASLGKSFSRGLTLCLAAFIFPILFIAFSFVRAIPLALLLLMGVGVSMILVLNLANALIQTITPDFLRGRVMGVYSLIFFGMMPVGSLWTGYLAHRIGEPSAVVFNALAMLLCAFLVWTTAPQVRSR